MRFMLIVLMLMISCGNVLSQEAKKLDSKTSALVEKLTVQQKNRLCRITDQTLACAAIIKYLDGLKARGNMDARAWELEKDYILELELVQLKEAKEILGVNLSETQILNLLFVIAPRQIIQTVQVQPAPSKTQAVFTLINMARFTGAVLLIVGIGWLLWHLVKRHLYIMEFLAYAFCFGLMYAAVFTVPQTGQYIALVGCLGLAPTLVFTNTLHEAKIDVIYSRLGGRKREGLVAWDSFILTVIWGACAIAFNSSMLGYMSVIALVSALGFSALVIPMGYAIGFRDDFTLIRATTACFWLLAAAVGIQFTNQWLSIPYVALFKDGVFFVCAFVYFLGMLIISSRYYSATHYILHQGMFVISGIAALTVGTLMGITEISKIGGTFFALYLLDKYYLDIPWKGVWAWGFATAMLGVLIYGLAMVAGVYPQYFLLS